MLNTFKRIRWRHDSVLIGNMMVLAACGLIYEYLLSHYAGRIIGAVETAIYTMIGIMIVSMGIGAFAAKWIKDPYRGFVRLELALAILGGASILIMSAVISLAYKTPYLLQTIYGLSDIQFQGGFVSIIKKVSFYLPFFFGFVIGAMVGMEIPLIARIREQIYNQHLEHNTGTIYGADYIGAGIGAALWVYYGLSMPLVEAASYTALLNLFIAVIFLYIYRKKISGAARLGWFSVLVLIVIGVIAIKGEGWSQRYNSTLFVDEVVYTKATRYQQLTITYQHINNDVTPMLSLYINGGLQFSENDEHIYHQMLITPVMLASARHDNILLIGGGDGLALRDILKWNPKTVTVIDLDGDMTDIFSGKDAEVPEHLRRRINHITNRSFSDDRVKLINADAYLYIETLIDNKESYDAIIVDLPDPRHPNLNNLYSDLFYARLYHLLSGDGALGVQSTSPYHSKEAFISIGKTISVVGFTTAQYHNNIPSFGEWGWTVATKHGKPPRYRIQNSSHTIPDDYNWINKTLIESAFAFSDRFFITNKTIDINHLGSYTLYHYYLNAWQHNKGLYQREM